MKFIQRLLTLATLGGAVLLAGCGDSSTASKEPPLPPMEYTVIQRSIDGASVTHMGTAISFHYTDGGCVSYRRPNQPENQHYSQLVCGGLITVMPKQ